MSRPNIRFVAVKTVVQQGIQAVHRIRAELNSQRIAKANLVGYAISRHIDADLTLAALRAAMQLRNPFPGSGIHHTDRGSQYASAGYRAALEGYGLIGSMSAVGNPYDNAQAEIS